MKPKKGKDAGKPRFYLKTGSGSFGLNTAAPDLNEYTEGRPSTPVGNISRDSTTFSFFNNYAFTR